MGKVSSSSVMAGIRGKVGELVFREVNGETVVQAYGGASRVKRSALQQSFNNKMRMASLHAREALRNPAVKAHYEKKKKRLKVSSAYTAACTDFLRHGCIDQVDTSKYNKGIVAVKAFKADLEMEEVVVKIAGRDGQLITAGRGVARDQGWWLFKSTVPLPKLVDVVITVGPGIRRVM